MRTNAATQSAETQALNYNTAPRIHVTMVQAIVHNQQNLHLYLYIYIYIYIQVEVWNYRSCLSALTQSCPVSPGFELTTF